MILEGNDHDLDRSRPLSPMPICCAVRGTEAAYGIPGRIAERPSKRWKIWIIRWEVTCDVYAVACDVCLLSRALCVLTSVLRWRVLMVGDALAGGGSRGASRGEARGGEEGNRSRRKVAEEERGRERAAEEAGSVKRAQ
eukprot:3941294-Rhodomonas_salina.1